MVVPTPPKTLFEPSNDFAPSEALEGWARGMFITEDAELFNPAHSHLQFATLGFLWATCENVTKGRRILGMAEIFNARCNKWKKGRQEQQLRRWFDVVPDFIITMMLISGKKPPIPSGSHS